MKKVLICPSPRSGVQLLSEHAPLATVPLLGEGLVEYWLSHLACEGCKEALLLSDDRPEQIETLVGNGERWGMRVTVVEEERELAELEAASRYLRRAQTADGAHDTPGGCRDGRDGHVTVMDHFPDLPGAPLFGSYRQHFEALLNWMPRARTADRVGVLEMRPGIQIGLHSHIAGKARTVAPCWIGKNVFIGARAIIGPNAIIEDGAFIEPGAVIAGSVIGKDTFVGQFANIEGTMALGNALVHLESGSHTRVPDRFLLCALRQARPAQRTGMFARLSELCNTEAQWIWKNLLLNRES
jgi:NDP-sugar pyrophosphorylase family protein